MTLLWFSGGLLLAFCVLCSLLHGTLSLAAGALLCHTVHCRSGLTSLDGFCNVSRHLLYIYARRKAVYCVLSRLCAVIFPVFMCVGRTKPDGVWSFCLQSRVNAIVVIHGRMRVDYAFAEVCGTSNNRKPRQPHYGPAERDVN